MGGSPTSFFNVKKIVSIGLRMFLEGIFKKNSTEILYFMATRENDVEAWDMISWRMECVEVENFVIFSARFITLSWY